MSVGKKLGIYLMAISLPIFLITLVRFSPHWFIENGTSFIGWILFIFTLLYNHVDQIYWLVQKVKYTVINPDTIWDLSVRYRLKRIEPHIISLIQNQFKKASVLDRATIRSLNLNRFEVKVDELSIEVFVDIENVGLEVVFSKIPVSFRGSQRTIEKRIVPILEGIERGLQVESQNYWLKVYFGDLNPYFGLYMRRLHQKNIKEMLVKVCNDKEDETLEISKQTLTIMTRSLGRLNEKARKYLTLSEMPA